MRQASATDLPKPAVDTPLRQLLPRGESRRMEFKRVSGKMVGKALETVCAFANTQGGTLVLGMADLREFQDPARLFGAEENPEAGDELQLKLFSEFRPAIDGLRLQRIACTLQNGPAKGKAGSVLLLQVPRSPRVHSIVNGGTYTRLDAGNRILSAGAYCL